MRTLAVVIRDPYQQYEGLRTSLGALLENLHVQMIVLDHVIQNMDEAYSENMEFLDEMEGERFSNNPENVEQYGFSSITLDKAGDVLRDADIVIPF